MGNLLQTSLLCITLKSLQTYMMMSHGHLLVKLRMGQIVTAESHDVSLRDFSNVPLQGNTRSRLLSDGSTKQASMTFGVASV